jgi:Homeodomain-like domain
MHDWELGPGPSAGIGRIGVAQWRQACASGGEAAKAASPVPGRPRKLTDQQCQQLLQLLLKGARAYGFPNELWTLKRMATVIWVEFRVRHHPSHVGKVLRSGLGAVRCRNAGPSSATNQRWRRASPPDQRTDGAMVEA